MPHESIVVQTTSGQIHCPAHSSSSSALNDFFQITFPTKFVPYRIYIDYIYIDGNQSESCTASDTGSVRSGAGVGVLLVCDCDAVLLFLHEIRKLLFVCELFSCYIILIEFQLQVRSRNNHRSDEERLIALMTALLYLVWLAAYAASTLFHVHETVLTERADYFLPVFATMTQLVYGIVVVSPFVRQHATLCLPIVVLPLTAFALYFMYVMLVVKFDYGWHNKIVITLLVSDVLVFVPWMIANVRRKPYVWYNVIGYLCIFGAAPLELFDFEPLLKVG